MTTAREKPRKPDTGGLVPATQAGDGNTCLVLTPFGAIAVGWMALLLPETQSKAASRVVRTRATRTNRHMHTMLILPTRKTAQVELIRHGDRYPDSLLAALYQNSREAVFGE